MFGAAFLAATLANVLVIPPHLVAGPRTMRLALNKNAAAIAAENVRAGSAMGPSTPIQAEALAVNIMEVCLPESGGELFLYDIPAGAVVDSVIADELAVNSIVTSPNLKGGAHAAALAVVAVSLVQNAPRNRRAHILEMVVVMVEGDRAGCSRGGEHQGGDDVETHVSKIGDAKRGSAFEGGIGMLGMMSAGRV